MSKLKPCPFCGGKAGDNFDGPFFIGHLKRCWLYPSTVIYPNDKEAISKWNRRAKVAKEGK